MFVMLQHSQEVMKLAGQLRSAAHLRHLRHDTPPFRLWRLSRVQRRLKHGGSVEVKCAECNLSFAELLLQHLSLVQTPCETAGQLRSLFLCRAMSQ